MNKSLTMQYYNKLRQTNPALAKTKEGRSMIMNEAVYHCQLFCLGFSAELLHKYEKGIRIEYQII